MLSERRNGQDDQIFSIDDEIEGVMRILVILVSCLYIEACDIGQDQWEGFVYPDASDLTIHKSAGVFDLLEACRQASVRLLRNLGALKNGDYECGLNCETKAKYGGLKVCEETLH